jgi:hypothetical protein
MKIGISSQIKPRIKKYKALSSLLKAPPIRLKTVYIILRYPSKITSC